MSSSALEPGLRIRVRAAEPADSPSHKGHLLGTLKGSLQIGLLEREGGARLTEGTLVLLTFRRPGVTWECRVVVRRRVDGARPQLLLDRPGRFLPSRLTLQQRETRVAARIELKERLPVRISEDAAPVVDGVVTRDTTVGAVVELARVRLKFGEAVRLSADPLSGTYVAYDELAATPERSECFLMRTEAGRAEGKAPARPVTPSSRPSLARSRR
jgi:hypothetical protein